MLDAGQDPSKLNSHAYARQVSMPSQENRMPPVLRHCKYHYASCLKIPCTPRPAQLPLRAIIDGKVLSDFPTRSILAGDLTKYRMVRFLLPQTSATTNEMMSGGSDIAAAFKAIFPSIQNAEINALIAVCIALQLRCLSPSLLILF